MDGDFEITSIPTGKEQEESYLGKAVRGVARGAARAVETVVGLPGDIEQTALSLTNMARDALGKEQLKQTESLFPTSERVRQGLTKPIEKALLPEGYLEPKGSVEEFGDTALSDLVSYLIPVAGAGKLTASAIKKAGILSGAGNLMSLASKQLGAGEGTQSAVKMGTMLIGSMGGTKQLVQRMKNGYTTAENSFPKTATVSAKKIQDTIKELSPILDLGEMTESKEFLKNRIKSIKDNIYEGTKTIRLNQAWELKKNMNEWLSDPKTSRKSAAYAKILSHNLSETLKDSGKRYPEFVKNLTEADSIFNGLHEQTKVAQFLNKHVKAETFLSPLTGVAFYLNPIGALKGAGFAYALKKSWLPAEAFARSPEIRKFYLKALGAAAKSNAPLAVKYIKKFDQEAANLYPDISGEWEVSSLG